jgi:hypothetical protein
MIRNLVVRLALTATIGAAALAASAPPAAAQELTADTFDRLAAHIRPAPAECSWQDIQWLESLGKGLAAAVEQQRPVLLWAMNGHPQGCT